jgi:hypothetical protein
MAYYRRDDWLQNALGQALAGGKVYYCSQPANTGVVPPSPLVQVYADSSGTAAANPQQTDGFGHAVAYLAAGTYTIVYVHPQMGTVVLTDQQVANIGTTPRIQADTSAAGTIAGAINSSNTVFTLSYTPSPTNSLLLFLNGIQQIPGVSYTLSGNTITFMNPPSAGSVLVAFYFY